MTAHGVWNATIYSGEIIMKIKRILIANRGEIALRALRTIQEMGKEAIVVHSTADKDRPYVKILMQVYV